MREGGETMATNRSNRSGSGWSDEAEELLLYLDNESDLYAQKKLGAANLLKKMKRGTYEHGLAPQAWSYVVDSAAKKYAKEFNEARSWHALFDAEARRQVSKELADRWHANAERGDPEDV